MYLSFLSIEVKGKKLRGRVYPWGCVEIENPEHTDFIKLRNMLITHMQVPLLVDRSFFHCRIFNKSIFRSFVMYIAEQDLQEVTQEVHYENYRLQKLAEEARAGVKAELISDPTESDKEKMKKIL